MKQRPQRGDIRTWLLLVLALVPTWSVLVGATWLWNERGNEISDFESALVPVDTTYELFVISGRMLRAEAALHVAALPGATDEAIERAEMDLANGLVALRSAEEVLVPLIEKLDPERDTLGNASVLNLMGSSLGLALNLFEDQVPGEPVDPQVDALVTLARDSAAGLVLPLVDSADQEAAYLYDAIAATIRYHDEFDRDRAIIIESMQISSFLAEDDPIRTSAIRKAEWKDVTDSRTFMPNIVNFEWFATAADPENPLLLDATEPLEELLRTAHPAASASQRDAFFLEVQKIDDALIADVELAQVELKLEANEHLAGLTRQRMLLAVTGGLMTILGLALAALTISEVRRRREVESAHGVAMTQLGEKADRDPTTGVWNRRRLESEVGEMVEDAPVKDETVILAYLDLDHFKAINDVWGHSTGDLVLRTVTDRLRDFSYRGTPFELCRFGGDEFVLYAQMPKQSLEWLEGLGETIIDSVDTEMDANGRLHEVGVSVGIATSNEDSTYDSLLLEADSSLIMAKQERGTAVVYNRDISRTGELVHAFPNALADGEICVHIQPVIDIITGKVAHVEALARWDRPNGESVSPAVFIPLVESYGLAEKLTSTVLGCVQRIVEDPATPADVRVWVNVSPRELDVANFAERFVAMLRQLGVPPTRIGLEITETAAVHDPMRLGIELRRLRDVGIHVAIDDFGNGYSPLGYLRNLPVDTVKIDRSLISHIDTDTANQHIVIGIVGMVHDLGMDIVAEGVERVEEQTWLRDHGVRLVQGYLFDKPMSPSVFNWQQRTIQQPDSDQSESELAFS